MKKEQSPRTNPDRPAPDPHSAGRPIFGDSKLGFTKKEHLHPEKVTKEPRFPGQKADKIIQTAQPDGIDGFTEHPEKYESSQSIGARRQNNPSTVQDAVEVAGATLKCVERQVGSNGNPKRRDA